MAAAAPQTLSPPSTAPAGLSARSGAETASAPLGVSALLRRPSSAAGPRTAGVVKFFNAQKGYGFIIPREGELEVFVHHTAILRPDGGFRSLLEGEEVEFDLIHGPKGLQAANVTGPNGAVVIGDPQAFQGTSPFPGMQPMYPLPPFFYPIPGPHMHGLPSATPETVSAADGSASYGNDKAQYRNNYFVPMGQQWTGYVQTPYGLAYMGPTPPGNHPQPPPFTYNGPPPGLSGNMPPSPQNGAHDSTSSLSPITSDVTTPPKSNERRLSSFSAPHSNSTLVMSSNGSLHSGDVNSSPGYATPFYYPPFARGEGGSHVDGSLSGESQGYQSMPNGGYVYYPAPPPHALPPNPGKAAKKGKPRHQQHSHHLQEQQHQQQPYQPQKQADSH